MTELQAVVDEPQMQELLAASADLHRHVCPRQVLGVRMGMLAATLLELSLPQSAKRVLTICETDGCFADGVAVATNCWVGHRTMRIEDVGKVAATFVDTMRNVAYRLAPHAEARTRAAVYAPDAPNRWQSMLQGYQRMPTNELLVVQLVTLRTPVKDLVSRAGHRVNCMQCNEEIINEREVLVNGQVLCRSCAGQGYYVVSRG